MTKKKPSKIVIEGKPGIISPGMPVEPVRSRGKNN